jgi:diadenosine tetraphosphate (Ap4A) HIT family hydrolase
MRLRHERSYVGSQAASPPRVSEDRIFGHPRESSGNDHRGLLGACQTARVDECPFCRRAEQTDVLLLGTPHAVAFPDAYPVTPGHTLVCPRRHVADVFALDAEEWTALWSAVRQTQQVLAGEVGADGWNVGVNAGAAAGQTVAHAHVHLIPRRHGDVPDARGGVRWVIPDRAPYWMA